MKAAAQLKWPPPTPSPVELAIASCEPGRRVVIPQNAAEVKPKDMRSVYEKMRKIIYGGGARIELQNIYYRENSVKEIEGQGRGQWQWLGQEQGEELTTTCIKNENKNEYKNKDDSGEIKNIVNPKLHTKHNTYLSIIKNKERSHRMVVDMGRFVDVLARKEALRDPLLIDASPDENTLQGLMNRKIVVDFGSRYKDEKGLGGVSSGGSIDNMGGMEIETNTGVKVIRQEKVVLNNEEINKNEEENDKDRDVEKEKEKEMQQMALLLDQTHTAYFMDTPLPPSDLDDGDEGEGDSDMLYGESASYLYTPMTTSDNDNENENEYRNGNENDMDMDTDSEFDKEMDEKEKGEGEEEEGREGESVREKNKGREMDRTKKSKRDGDRERDRDRDRDPCTAGEYWNVTDATSESSSVTIDDTYSTDSSRHIDSDTTHTNTHTLGIADRDNNSNMHAPSFTLSPLSSFVASSSSSSSSTPLSSPTSHTGMLALPPLGRPYASLNGKRKRLAGVGAGVGMMMGGIAMHIPTPINSSSPSIPLSPLSSSSSSSSSSDAVDDGRTSHTPGTPGKGQRQGSREDQLTPHSPLPASVSTSTSATATASTSSGARKDQPVASSSHLAGSSPSPSSSSSSSSSNTKRPADGDVTYLPITPHPTPTPPPPPPTVSSGIDGTLPAGWLQKFSNREKKNYWFNVITGESIWVKPS